MIIEIDDTDARPIYQQIVDEVRRAVLTGSLRPDDALPSVRQLAAELQVNPNTVALAYRELERAGLTYGRRGQGTFVTELPEGAAARERDAVAASVAREALREAARHGVSAEEFLEAVRHAVVGGAPAARSVKGGTR